MDYDNTNSKPCSSPDCSMDNPQPLTEFHKSKSVKSGLASRCKTCTAKWVRKYRKDSADKVSAFPSNSREKRKERNDRYRETHRDQINERNRIWEINNPDKRLAVQKRWYANNIERVRERKRRWRLRNIEKSRAQVRNRRAKQKQAEGAHTAADILKQGDMQKWRCWWCLVDCKDKYHVDHRIPINKGGSNDRGNLVIACEHCNTSRADKLPHEWSNRLL